MVPRGAVHIPLRSTVRVCKRLGIDYAEAVTGFEFGNKRAVPVITGVVVAEENEHAVIDQWEKEEEERRIKEEGKREKVALATWRKWLMGLRIVQRVREEYGQDADAYMKEEMNPFTNQNKRKRATPVEASEESKQKEDVISHPNEDMGGGFLAEDDFEGGGFLPEGHDEEEIPHRKSELIVEADYQSVKSGPASDLPPRAFATTAMSDLEDGSGLSSLEDSDEDPARPVQKSKSAMNDKEAESKAQGASIPKKSLANGKKSKAPTHPEESDLNEVPAASKQVSTKSVSAAPKRKAARKSETAVKSHYFEHSSDDEDEGYSDSSVSEEKVVKQPGRKKKKANDSIVSTKGRSLRTKKSM